MKRLLAMYLSVVLLFGLAACATENTTKQDLPTSVKIGVAYDPATFDPAELNMDSATDAAVMIYAPLLEDRGGSILPGIAETWEHSEDSKTWTFHLRDSKYADGSSVTAADFEFAILRAIDPAAAHGNVSSLLYIAGADAYYNEGAPIEEVAVNVLDEKTLEITYTIPMFESSFTSHLYAPVKAELSDALGIEYGSAADKMLTNGAYTIQEWVPDSSFKLVKNENYWDAASIILEEITFVVGGAASDTAVDMMQSGELGITHFSNINQINALTGAGYSSTAITTSYRSLNVNLAGSSAEMSPFMGNVNFRKALNLAINREQLCATVFTTDLPANRLTAPSELGYQKPFNEEYPYEAWPTAGDVDEAKKYLDTALRELGKSAEDIPVLVLLCYESESSVTALSAVQDMLLQNLGLSSEISSQTIQNMIGMAYSGQYDFWLGGNSVSTPDWLSSLAMSYTSYSFATTPGLRGYHTDEFDALYDFAINCGDYKERKDAMFVLEKYFCENVLNIITSWTSTYYVVSPLLNPLTFRADGTPSYSFLSYAA